jgi:hypothetical protein
MNEITKTSIFIAMAVVLALVAFLVQPGSPEMNPEDRIGQKLFPDFEDPLAAEGIEIVKYNEQSGEPTIFRVKQIDNRWVIPSHENYPADAREQMSDAASALMDLEVSAIPFKAESDSDIEESHALYGVLDPANATLSDPAGAGLHVTMSGGKEQVLLDLIIGKEIPDQPGFRYVRIPEEDPVYEVAVETDALTTTFTDWIEKNLLDISTFDIQQIEINDYSVDVIQGVKKPEGIITLDYDDTATPKWSLASEQVFQGGKYEEKPLGEDEELNTSKLNELTGALDDLKIVDVTRKPEALAEALRSGKAFGRDQLSMSSLFKCGFYLVPVADPEHPNDPSKDTITLLSNEGEISVRMSEGVEYVLRFGQLTGEETAAEETSAEEGETAEEEGSANRYLFISARFVPEAIPEPDYLEVPELPEEKEGEADAAEGEEADHTDETPEEDAPTEEEIKEIKKENQRLKDEHEQKIADGKERVKELNDRFADWYYIISEDVYRKIHLDRDQIVQPEGTEAAENEAGAEGGMPPGSPFMPAGEGGNPMQQFGELQQGMPDVPSLPEGGEAPEEEATEPPATPPEIGQPEQPEPEQEPSDAAEEPKPESDAPETSPEAEQPENEQDDPPEPPAESGENGAAEASGTNEAE